MKLDKSKNKKDLQKIWIRIFQEGNEADLLYLNLSEEEFKKLLDCLINVPSLKGISIEADLTTRKIRTWATNPEDITNFWLLLANLFPRFRKKSNFTRIIR